jgi:hypothetical protein
MKWWQRPPTAFAHNLATWWPLVFLVNGWMLRIDNLWVSIPLTVLIVAGGPSFGRNVARHEFHLCVTCSERFPEDPGAYAVAMRRDFRAVHALAVSWPRQAAFAVGFAVLAYMVPWRAWWPLAILGSVLGAAMLGWFLWVKAWHGALREWCPECRDDGDDASVSVPDPIGSSTA